MSNAPRYVSLLAITLLASFTSPLGAVVGDPTLRTDHPHYPGEGAFQTADDCVRFATEGHKSEQEKALALYNWILTHQWHLMSPQEPSALPIAPDTAKTNEDLIVYDASRARFSYGYGLCGTVHAWNEPYWKSLGFNVRRRAFPGHTNSEIEYGGAWHTFDTDMAGLLFRKDGVVAGYEDIIADRSIIKNSKPPVPCYPFAWPGDYQAMVAGWEQVAQGGNWFKMYNSGYEAHPGIISLRRGETFTRYYNRDHFGGLTKRRFWHHQAGGPARNWTFANNGTPEHTGEKHNARSSVTYCNGLFEYTPDLSTAAHLEGVIAKSTNLIAQQQSPLLTSKEGAASIEFKHFSPYVICGDPVDDANPMTGKATDGLVIEGQAVGKVTLAVSTDEGQTWSQDQRVVAGAFREDFTDIVKGHYGWRVRCTWQAASGLDQLKFTTTTQVCEAIYPRLKPSGSEVLYRVASRGVTPVLPNWSLSEAELTKSVEVHELRSSNVKYAPRSLENRMMYQTTNNKPGQVVFRVQGDGNLLTEIRAAARYKIRSPAPEETDFHLDYSVDEGKTWTKFGEAITPTDNEFSSGWVYGKADLAQQPIREALVRVHFYQGGYPTGLFDVQMYGVHQTPSPPATNIVYAWREAGEVKTYTKSLAKGTFQQRFTVPTGPTITDEFVRLEVP